MRITDVQVDEFGVWSDLNLEELSERITVFYGPNEAGKTTLLHFIRSMLYGISPERQGRYWSQDGPVGGSLGLRLPDGQFLLSRHVVPSGSTAGNTAEISTDNGIFEAANRVTVTARDGTVCNDQVLATLLEEVDETTFSNVFAVGLRELQELGSLSDIDAAQWLYGLTVGLDRVSLVEVMRELEASRNRILSSDNRPSQVTHLLGERERLTTEIDELAARVERWLELSRRHTELDRQIERLEAEKRRLDLEARILESAVAVKDPWSRRESIDNQLAKMGSQQDLPAGGIDQLEEAIDQLKRRRRKREELKQQYHDLRDEVGQLGNNTALWRHGARIEALRDQQTWIDAIEVQLRERQAEVAAIRSRLKTDEANLGLDGPSASVELTEAASRALTALRKPALAVRAARQNLATAKQELAIHRNEATALSETIREKLSDRTEQDLTTAVESTGNRVSQMRRRVGLDERLDQLGRRQQESEHQSSDLLEEQLLPFWVLVSLGVMFALGVAMMLAGFLLPTSFIGTLGKALAVIGILGTAAAGLIKFLMERSIASRLDSCQNQLDLLDRQVAQAKKDRDELDQHLPPGGGPLTSRLQEAERELAGLEEKLPIDAKWQTADRDVARCDERIGELQAQLTEAISVWRDALTSFGLPSELTPNQVRGLAGQGDQLVQLRTRLDQHQQDLQQTSSHYDALAERIVQLASDVGVPDEGRTSAELLRRIVHLWEEQRPKMERSKRLKHHVRRLKERASQLSRSMFKLEHRRDALLYQAGVSSPEEFRRIALQASRMKQLQRERDSLDREITTAIGLHTTDDVISRLLSQDSIDQLEVQWEEKSEQAMAHDEKLKQLIGQRGAWGQELQELAEDRQFAEKQLELSILDTRLAEALQAWQVRCVTWLLLNAIRQDYETQRQPETLVEASGYLKRLTDNRYRRVWTPLDGDILYVEDRDGHSLPVELLSRGTREQLFLSLRLALVALFTRRGILLPLVLDDVLVNFDDARAKSAAKVLRDFAKAGHQLLVFTCHEHVWKMFKSLKVDVRRLPTTGTEEAGPQIVHSQRRREAKPPVEETPPIRIDHVNRDLTQPILVDNVVPTAAATETSPKIEMPQVEIVAAKARIEATEPEFPNIVGMVDEYHVNAAFQRAYEQVYDAVEDDVNFGSSFHQPRDEGIRDEWVRIGERVRRRETILPKDAQPPVRARPSDPREVHAA